MLRLFRRITKHGNSKVFYYAVLWLTMKVTHKLKSVLGDVEGLKRELVHLQEENGFKSLADSLVNKYGGLDKAKKRWYDEYIVLIGVCDICNGALDYDCKITDNADGSANVVCKSCVSK